MNLIGFFTHILEDSYSNIGNILVLILISIEDNILCYK